MFGSKETKRDLEVYALHDSSTNQYNLPSFYMTELEARRSAERMFQDPRHKDSLFVTNSADFTLFHVGYYDRATGNIESLKTPRRVLNMLELKTQISLAELNNQTSQ